MKYNDLFQNFINDVPEGSATCLANGARAGLDDGDGMHIWYAFAIRPYVEEVLQKGDRNTIKKIAVFFEKMEASGDPHIAEVLEQSLMEHLLAENRDLLRKYDDLWGRETKEAFRAVGEFVA